jgi:hypothetical protein
VKHRASPRFWRCYRGLPKDVQSLADKSYALLKTNPSHPSLHFKKVGPFWSTRVGLHYRALAVESGEDRAWFWIGSHAEYDKLLGQKPANRRMQPTRVRRPEKKPKGGARG